jgi:hypothetical protein
MESGNLLAYDCDRCDGTGHGVCPAVYERPDSFGVFGRCHHAWDEDPHPHLCRECRGLGHRTVPCAGCSEDVREHDHCCSELGEWWLCSICLPVARRHWHSSECQVAAAEAEEGK